MKCDKCGQTIYPLESFASQMSLGFADELNAVFIDRRALPGEIYEIEGRKLPVLIFTRIDSFYSHDIIGDDAFFDSWTLAVQKTFFKEIEIRHSQFLENGLPSLGVEAVFLPNIEKDINIHSPNTMHLIKTQIGYVMDTGLDWVGPTNPRDNVLHDSSNWRKMEA